MIANRIAAKGLGVFLPKSLLVRRDPKDEAAHLPAWKLLVIDL
jgi:hypothetical protein